MSFIILFAAPTPQPRLPYGICIDVTLCQQPPYHSICSQGLPICPSPATQPSTLSATKPVPPSQLSTPSLSQPTTKISTVAVPTSSGITASKSTALIKSTHISGPGKQVNVLTIQNNFKISFGGKKSNIKKPGKP